MVMNKIVKRFKKKLKWEIEQEMKTRLNSAYGKSVYKMTQLEALDQIKKLQEEKKDLIKENERLHGVIQHLTRELDEAEEHAYAMQEKLSTMLQERRF